MQAMNDDRHLSDAVTQQLAAVNIGAPRVNLPYSPPPPFQERDDQDNVIVNDDVVIISDEFDTGTPPWSVQGV